MPFGDADGVREAAGDVGRIAELASGADVVLTHLAPVGATLLRSAPRLSVVGVTRGGPVNVDLAEATRRGVPVVYLPGRNLGAVAEFTVGVMIALPRGIASSSAALAQGRWDSRWFRFEQAGPELSACTVGLVGLGAVGLRVAELLSAFGSRVIAHDPYADPDELRARGSSRSVSTSCWASSDIVSLHARLTDETRHLVRRGRLGSDAVRGLTW